MSKACSCGGTCFSSSAFLVLAVVMLAGVSTPAATQAGAQGKDRVRVILGEDTMVPGYQVTIPCELETPAEVKAGRIELEVTFPTAKTTFDSIRRGLISDQIDARIDYQIQVSEANSGFSTVKLSIAPKEQIAIPSGFLFDLVFNISKEMATDDPPVVLKNKSRVYVLGDLSRPLPGVETQDGLIRVVAEPPPVTSCFFYMH